MKYLILVGDGMGDHPLAEFGGRTPLEIAETPGVAHPDRVLWMSGGKVLEIPVMENWALLEDALKHVWTCETLGRDCTLESLAGQLEVIDLSHGSLTPRDAEILRLGDSAE